VTVVYGFSWVLIGYWVTYLPWRDMDSRRLVARKRRIKWTEARNTMHTTNNTKGSHPKH
jgi:hypothetical protein